jgi:hypothetical protein
MNKLLPPPPPILRKLRAHERWLRSRGEEGKRFSSSYMDFIDLNLDGVDLSLGLLTGCHFEGSSLCKAWFIGARLDDADLYGCDIRGARFDYADLELATFIGATFNRASFKGAKKELTIWSERDVEPTCAVFDAEAKARGHLYSFEKQHSANTNFAAFLKKRDNAVAVRQRVETQELLEFWRNERFCATGSLHP